MISVDTSLEWVERTKSNLALLGITSTVDFRILSSTPRDGQYDVVFVDGADELRLPFAISSWYALVPRGDLTFHDTRRHRDFLYVTNLTAMCASEVESLALNCSQSNISVVKKRMWPLGNLHVFPSLEKLDDLAQTSETAANIAIWGPSDLVTRIGEQIGTPVFTIITDSKNTHRSKAPNVCAT